MAKVTPEQTRNRAAALDIIQYRRQGYQRTFDVENQSAKIVLADLARFCRAGKSTFDPNPQVSALLQGRQEVFQRIADHMNMTVVELYDLFARGVK